MAFSRHNIEKRRLIELVRLNPILWDCRLPHYKRSDKKKAIKWNELGRLFNVSGERVQRTFTSLREIFRRELNHEKMLGSTRFKSKWEYYEAMAFLKEVIRERKSRDRVKVAASSTNNNNNNNNNQNNNNNNSNHNNNSVTHDEYQYFAPSDPNNPNNQPKDHQQQQQQQQQGVTTSALISQLPIELQQQAQHLHALQLQPDVTITSLLKSSTVATTTNTNTITTTTSTVATPIVAAATVTTPIPPAVQSPTPAHIVCSSRSSSGSSCGSNSSSPSIYIKDEPDSPEDATAAAAQQRTKHRSKLHRHRSHHHRNHHHRNRGRSLKVSGDIYPTTGIATATGISPHPHLIINANNELIDADAGDLDDDNDNDSDDDDIYDDDDGEGDDDDDGEEEDDIDDDEDDINDGRLVSNHPSHPPVIDQRMGGRLSPESSLTGIRHHQQQQHQQQHQHHQHHQPSVRETLYIKFGDFLAARLNTLHETVANDLMNKILLLIAEK